MTLPRLTAADLEIGDVLLFRAASDTGWCIRLVDQGDYDHAGLVVTKGRTPQEVHFAEVNWGRAVAQPLWNFGEPVERILVRRHRIPNAALHVELRGLEVVNETSNYAYHRLFAIALSTLTRFTHTIADLSPEDQLRFHSQVFALLDIVTTEPINPMSKTCVELVRDSFDTPVDQGPSPYYGLVLPIEPIDGLLSWVAAGRSWIDFLVYGPPVPTTATTTNSVHEKNLDIVFRSLIASFEHLPVSINVELTETALGAKAVRGAQIVLEQLGAGTPAYLRTEMAVQLQAMVLLEHLLRTRAIVTPRDIRSTRSLYDVGELPGDVVRRRAL
jgi:hypothetical protein